MTTKYDEAMFEFLTKADNFSFAFEVSENFDLVKNKLIEDFWIEIKEHIEEKVKKENKSWKIEQTAVKPQDLHLGFSWQNGQVKVMFQLWKKRDVYYGLWINTENEQVDIKKFRENKALEKIRRIREMHDKYEKWPCATNSILDFDKRADLEKILPTNRQNLVLELVNTLFELTEELESSNILSI